MTLNLSLTLTLTRFTRSTLGRLKCAACCAEAHEHLQQVSSWAGHALQYLLITMHVSTSTLIRPYSPSTNPLAGTAMMLLIFCKDSTC